MIKSQKLLSKKMKRELISKTYENILEDWKLIKLATITSFFHSLVLMCLIIYRSYSIFQTYNGQSTNFQQVWEIFSSIIDSWMIWGFVVLALIAAIWYYLVPPISDAALIWYLEKKNSSWAGKISSSIWKWFSRFFPLFEFNGSMSVFNVVMRITTLARAWANWVLQNPFIAGLLIIWGLVIFAVDILTPFTKFFIVLEKMKVFEAMKASSELVLENLWTTIKFVLIKYFLGLRFLINIVLVVGLPVAIVYYGNEFFQNNLQNVMLGLFIFMLIVTAYITGIIEAFFTNYWYNVYKSLKPEKVASEK